MTDRAVLDQDDLPENVGDTDFADKAQFACLLLRGLDTSIKEDIFAKGVAKLYRSHSSSKFQPKAKDAPTKLLSTSSATTKGAPDNSIKRVFIVRDRRTDESKGFGFAEFYSVQDAEAAMIKYNALPASSYTIGSKPITVSFCHTGVFKPVSITGPEQSRYVFPSSTISAQWLEYWNPHLYASYHNVSTAPSPPSAAPAPAKAEPATKKRKAEDKGLKPNKSQMTIFGHWQNKGKELRESQLANSEKSADDDVEAPGPQTSKPKKLFGFGFKAKYKPSTVPAAPPRSSPSPPPPQPSKGQKMMAKMGHVAGAGLGAEGAGTLGPIETSVYATGVGLGAEGGKVGDAVEEAERRTKEGREGGFLRKTKELARKRFEGM